MTQSATRAIDIVGVFDVNLNQVFPEARPLKSSVNDNDTFFTHPLEDSSIRADHIIQNPIEISTVLMISGENYESVYKQIKQLKRNQTELIVQTKVDTYEKMYIQAIPHEETPDNYDGILMNLELLETQIAGTEIVFIPASMADSNTQDRGQQEPEEEDSTTTAQRIVKWFGGFGS